MRITDKQLYAASEYLVLGLVLVTVLWRGGKSLDATWLLALVAGAVTFYWYWKGRKQIPALESREVPALIWIGLYAYLLWSIVSFLFSTTQNYGLDELMRDASVTLLFFWIIRQGPQRVEKELSFIEKLIIVLVVATVLACVVGALVYTLQPVSRFVGTFFDYRFHTDYWPNAWAEYLLLTWPVVLHFAMKKHISVVWGFLLLGFVLGCLLLSYSRGAFIAFLGQIVLLAIFSRQRVLAGFFPHKRFAITPYGKKMLFSVFFLVVLAITTFLLLNNVRTQFFEVQDVSDKVTFTSAEGGSSISERIHFWQQALELMSNRPFLGWGPYSFRFIQPVLQTEILATSDHPHNIFLKIGMERGFIGAVLFVLILSIILLRPRSLRLYRENFSHALIATGIVGVLAHNLIDYNVQFVGIVLPLWLILGIIVRDTTGKGSGVLNTKVVRISDLLLGMILLLVVFIEGRTLALSAVGRHAHARGEVTKALEWYESAENELFSRDLHLSRAQLLLSQDRYDDAQEALQDYLAQNAEDGRAWLIQGDIDVAKADFKAAAISYGQAERVLRWNDLTPLRSALEMMHRANDRAALDARKEEVMGILEKYAQAFERNAHFIALGNNVGESLKIVAFLSEVYPDDAPKLQILGARVDRHAKAERAKVEARAPGYLW
ncbi:O-antigen ligase family protein [Candidatus Peregrinibacteria bacterium]|nr:O-antigen ligase family protein [Candidatus Peregrinibacteria bacterium]